MSKTNNKTKKPLNKKKLITTIIAIASAILIVVSTLFVINSFAPANPKSYHKFVLSTFNGSYNKDGLPKSYWQVSPVEQLDSKENVKKPTTTFARYYVQYDDEVYTSQIWINVSDVYNDTEILIAKGGGSPGFETSYDNETYTYKLTKQTVKNSNDGWIKIYDAKWKGAFKINSRYLWLGFKNTKLRVREVAFISENGNISSMYNDNTIMGVYGEDYKKIGILEGVEKTTDEYDLVKKRFGKK